MSLTKEQIKEKGIKKYYILIDEMNDDKIARCETIKEIQKEARAYHKECDGEWLPLLLLYSRETKKSEIVDEWYY